MKRIPILSLFFLGLFLISSCKKSNSSSNSVGGTCSWTMTFDSQSFSWTGTYPATGTNDGQAVYTANSGLNPIGAMVMASPTNGGIRAQNMVTL